MPPTDPDEIDITIDDLLVFIDDTGHESFAGDQAYYGLGGCIIRAQDYPRLKTLWQEVRRTIHGDPERPLHAAHFPRGEANFSALQTFFADPSFIRLAATITKDVEKPEYMVPADPVMGQVSDEMTVVAGMLQPQRVVLVVESSQRFDPILKQRFGYLQPFERREPIPILHYLMPKSGREIGLEIADFIINAAGSQTRRFMAGHAGFAKDFEQIFGQLPAIGCRFSLIRKIVIDEEHDNVGVIALRLSNLNSSSGP